MQVLEKIMILGMMGLVKLWRRLYLKIVIPTVKHIGGNAMIEKTMTLLEKGQLDQHPLTL